MRFVGVKRLNVAGARLGLVRDVSSMDPGPGREGTRHLWILIKNESRKGDSRWA